MKKILFFMLSLIVCLSLSVPAFAAETTNINSELTGINMSSNEIQPLADTDHYYQIRNKVYRGTQMNILDYLTNRWAKANSYSVTEGKTRTTSLSVSVISGIFGLTEVKGTGQFTHSISTSFSVGTTIPADSSRNSKLTIQEKKNIYTGDLYYIIDYGHTQSVNYRGTGYIYEPADLYLVVIYE